MSTFRALLRPCAPPGSIYAFPGTPGLCTQCTTPDACCTPTTLTTQETHTVPDTNPKAARAIADGKLRLELIETAMTHPVARVMAHGAEKYGVRNWRTQPIYLRTYIGAMRRHTDAIASGEWFDPDSGQPHAAHVAACVQVILDARAHGTLHDDTDFAEGGVPGGVAANVEGGAKVELTDELVDELTSDAVLDHFYVPDTTPEYERGQDELTEELAAAAAAVRARLTCCLGDGEGVTAYCHTDCVRGGPRVAS